MTLPTVLIMVADYGHDPTETAVPYKAIKNAGFSVQFCTEAGVVPQCDKRMLEGVTQKLLGAKQSTVQLYAEMAVSEEFQNPLSWTAPGFSLDSFSLVLFPGGHDKSIRQILDSPLVHRLVVDYFPKTKKPAKNAVAAICHGVMVLTNAKDSNGRSPISECTTTALPTNMERLVYWSTMPVLGDYYKTYGAGSENVEQSVRKNLTNDKQQWKGNMGLAPFVVEDKNYNYISGRFPGDADLFGERIVKLLQSFTSDR